MPQEFPMSTLIEAVVIASFITALLVWVGIAAGV